MIKVGSDVPTKTKAVLILSASFPLFFAANTPNEIPTLSHNTNAPIAKLKVIGKASATIVVTHSWRLNE